MRNKLIACIVLIFFISCKKMIDAGLPKNQLVTHSVFADSANAAGAVYGIYAEMMNVSTQLSFGNGSITLFTGLAADELLPTAVTSVTDNEFYGNAISPENSAAYALWSQAYKLIYQCNASMDGLAQSSTLSITVTNQLKGECLFLRSYIYFNLVHLFGDVPYVTDINYTSNALLPRQQKDSVVNHLVNDLLESKQLLSASYVTIEKVRVNKMVAAALLARIYLYRQNWKLAEELSTEVIGSGIYTLEPVLNNVFLPGSREAIWQLRPVQTSFNTAEGQVFNPTASASTRPKYAISNFLLSAFEAGDNRKVSWVKSKLVSGTAYTYPFKYKLRSDANPAPSEYYSVLRLAEQYLIRSEARLQQDLLVTGTADLNIVRQRAGLSATGVSTKAALLTALEHERQSEFFAEGGHRWFDLKRWGRADAVLAPVKAPGWQSTDQLFPVPFTELKRNPFLQQNPGY